MAGVHKTTYDSIMKCDIDIRKDLYNNLYVHFLTWFIDIG